MDAKKSAESTALREKAESLLKNRKENDTSYSSEGDALKLLHELEVYTLELELQNEELLNVKANAEKESKRNNFSECVKEQLIHEFELNQIEMEMQNDELVISNTFSSEIAKQYYDLFNFAPVAYFIVSKEGEIIDLNYNGAQILHKDRYKLKNSKFGFFVAEDYKQVFWNFLSKVFTDNSKTSCELSLIFENFNPIIVQLSGIPTQNKQKCLITVDDVTELRQTEILKDVTRDILLILNESGELKDSIHRTLSVIKNKTGFDAVGIRLQKDGDYPYFEQIGFTRDFLLTENTLIELDKEGKEFKDKDGNVCLACTCGQVISGTANIDNPFFTTGGSWWTNDSNSILDIPSNEDDRFYPRNHCIQKGYASIALIPIRHNSNIVGLIQLNDKRKDRFNRNTIDVMEGIASHIGAALMRKQAEELLRKNEELLRTITENAPDVILELDRSGTIQYISRVLPGYKFEDVVGKNFCDWSLPEYHSIMSSALEAVFINGTLQTYESRGYGSNGEIRWYRSSLAPVMTDGIVKNAIMIARDITERLQNEEKIKRIEEQRHTILLAAMDGYWVTDMAGNILDVNDMYCSLSGYSKSELLTMRIQDLEFLENEDSTLSHIQKVIAEGYDRFETRHRRKDGSNFEVEIKVQFRTINGGQFVTFLHDITERKRALENLRQSEQRHKLLAETMLQGVVCHNSEGDIISMNPAAVNILGKSPEFFLGSNSIKNEFDSIREDGSPFLANDHPAMVTLRTGEQFHGVVMGVYNSILKEYRWISIDSVPIFRLGENKPYEVYTIFEDITERKHSEDILNYQAGLIENVSDAIISTNADFTIKSWNSSAENIYGWKCCEVLGKSATEILQTEFKSISSRTESINQLQTLGIWQDEVIQKRKDNTSVNIFASVKVIKDKAGNISGYVTVNRDVSERKRSEAIIREGEERYKSLFNSNKSVMLLLDPNTGEIKDVNSAACTFYGWSYPEMCSKNISDINTLSQEELIVEMELAKQEHRNHFFFKHRLANNEVKDVEVYSGPIQFGETTLLYSLVHDISERKQAENALKESEQKLRKYIDSAPHGVFVSNLNGEYVEVNAAASKIIGYSKEELLSMTIMDTVSEESFEGAINHFNKVVSEGFASDELAFIRKDKSKGYWSVDAVRLSDNLFLGFVTDISERKKSENALRESEESVRLKLQSILSPEGSIADLDLNDIIDAPSIQKLMDSFYELAQVPMAIIDVRGNVLVGIGWQDICTKFHRVHPKACRNCFESDVHLTAGIPDGEFKLYKCKNNMWDMATPIIIGDEHKGNLYMGQFFFDDEPVNDEVFLKQAKEYGFEEKEYMEALHKVPRLSKQKIDSSKAFFLNLSRSISQLSYSNIKLARAITQQQIVEGTLREKDELLNKAHQIAHLGSWSLDVIANKLIWSDEIYRIFGLQPNEFPATYEGFLNAVHPDDREVVNLAYSNSIQERKDSYEIEHRILRKKTGELLYVYEKCEHIKDASGKIIQSIGMVHDITERKLKENTLRKLNQTLLVLSKTNQAMSQLEDETEYLKQVCNIIVEDTDFKMAWIGYAEKDEAKTVRPMASSGFKTDYVEMIHVTWDDSEFGLGPTGTAIRTGNMSMCNDMLTDPAFEPWREQAIKHGFSSSIVFPLKAGETVFGAISIYSKVPESFLDVEIKMLMELAGDLAQGIANIRLRAAHKQAEKALSESHNELEVIVKQRTRELQLTNDMLIKEINIRKQKEQNLKITEEKYRTVAEYNYDWETWLGPDGKFVYVSPSCESITGYSVDEFMKDPSLFFEITHPDDREMVENHTSESIKGTVDNCSEDFRIITKNGEERWIGHNCQPVYNANGKFIGQRGSNRDITQRKKTERILIDSQTHLRELTQRMDIITEEERIRIAREIHDELGHLLTALKYDVEGLINNTQLSEDLIKSELNAMISMIEALIDSVRKIATELRPGILDHLGLFPAIEWKISQFKMKNKISCEYTISDFDIDFDKNETTIIYKILQEVFTNITRHSKAKNVWVFIDKENDYFILKVTDDGVGFQINVDSQTGSLGLMGMRERAMSIGGEIKIDSEPGNGTTVTFLLKK